MTKTKRKTITVLGIIITALMILAMVFNDVQAAAPRLIKGDFENPAQGVRLDGKYSDGLDVTGDTTVEVIGGKNRRVADSNVDNIFTNFDNDYNAGWVRYPGAKDGFHKGQNRIFTGDYNDLTGHITADENAARGFQKWNMFNLKNAANNEIKIKVSNLNYYNADKATGRDGNNDKINAIITINSWDVATSSNDSALVENFSFSESTPNFSYDEAVERLESSDCRCSSLWSKDNNGKYTYNRPDSDPYLIVSINTKSGLPGIRTARLQNVKYTVEFEYAEDTADGKHKAGDSAKLSTNVSATDIDTQQGVHMTPGGTSHVEAYAIPDNSSFTYNGGEVLIEEDDKYRFKFDDQRPPENRDNKPYDAFAIYTDTDKYSMTFISGYQGQGGYSYFAQTSAPSVFYTPNDPVKTIGWTGENNDETHDGRTAESRTNKGITANMTEAQKWAKVRSLTRDDLVSNKDNASGQNAKQSALIDAINTLFNRKITFKISHRVGNDYNDYNKFSKYRIKDTFDPAFELITEGEDAPKMSGGGSSNFTVTTNGQYVEANANDPKADSLYGNDHILVVKAYLRKEMFDLYGGNLKISDYINSEGRLIAVPNTAQVVIDDGGPAWTAGQTEDSTLNQFVKSTDTTFATVVVPKPKKENLEKYVADADNRKLTGKGTTAVGDGYKEIYNLLSPGGLTENTLDNPIDDYTYYVAQSLNQGYTPYWYFKSFEITDSVENQPLKIVDGSAKVHRVVITKDGENVTYSKPSNSDATSDFDISIENGTKIKATAKAASLNNQNFYRQSDGKANRYVLEFKVKIDKSQYDYKPQIDKWFDDSIIAGESKGYTWKNTANVKITDNADPDLTQNSEEQAAASWDKNSNETKTHIFAPRFEVTKTTNPYEFQVGDDIPYTIKIKNIEQNTTAGWVEGIDAYNTADDFPDGYTIKDVKATGGTDPNAEVVGSKKIKMTATKLPYNEELTTTFKAVADKTLNGKVLKNTAYARAWGIETDSDFSKWAAKANTSVYINSPKLNVTKEKVSERIDSSSNNKIDYKTEITNVNPGTFMRNIYAIDTSETKGLTIDMSSITVKNSGEGTLKEGRDYVIETYSADKVNMYNITGEDDEFYTITTSSEKAQNTGDQLPSAAYGGFYIKFIGKYRNLGYQDKTIPATSDERGKTATYLSDELKASEKKYGGVDYTTDYANLDLKDKIVIYYSMTQNADFDENAKNFIRTPATENTNGDMINNNDDLPKAGDPKVASGGDFAENTIKIEHRGEPGKSVDEEQATKDAELHYTISGKNTGDEIIKDPELVDTLVTKNFECDKNSFKVYKNSTDDKNLLSSDKYTITHDDANYKFTVKVPGANLKQGESIVVTYSGVVTKDIKSTDGSKRVQELTEEEVVHNKVTFMGSDAQVWTPNNDPENPNPKLTKDVKEKTTQVGGTLHYTITGENVSGAAAKDVVFEDEIKTKNLKYNQDSIKVVFIKGSDKSETDLTSSLKEGNKITFTDDSFKVETGKDLDKGDKIVITYSGEVQKSDDESIKSVDNEVVMTGSNFSALKDNEKVPFGNPDIVRQIRRSSLRQSNLN